MQPDLQNLEISPGELRHLTGVEPTEVFRLSLLRYPKERFNFLVQELILSLAVTPIIVGLLHVFVILPFIGSSLVATISTLFVVPILVLTIRWFWLKRHSFPTLCALLDEVERYHTVIKAIHINDQLQAAGTTKMSVCDRQNVIEALTLTKEDLIRALRAERILRENRSFLVGNPELLATNLQTLQSLQVNDYASEYGRLLNEALQIAAGVQEEMKKLQNIRY